MSTPLNLQIHSPPAAGQPLEPPPRRWRTPRHRRRTASEASGDSPSPRVWLHRLLGLPYNAVRTDFIPFTDLPNDSCRKTQTCSATLLFTGGDPSFAKNLAQFFFVSSLSSNVLDYVDGLPNFVMFIEPAFSSLRSLYVLQPKCLPNFTLPLQIASKTLQKEVKCVEGLSLWRNSASLINDEVYKGYQLGNVKKDTNEIAAAYDFLTSNENHFMVNIWYNASYKEGTSGGFKLVRVPRSLNVLVIYERGTITPQ